MVRRGLMKMKISYFYKECYAQEDFIEIFIRPLLPSISVLLRTHDLMVATPHKTRKHRDNLTIFVLPGVRLIKKQ